jgi:hypothetical protein
MKMTNFNDKSQTDKSANIDQKKSSSTTKQPAPVFGEKVGQASPKTELGKQPVPKDTGSMHDARQGNSPANKPKL